MKLQQDSRAITKRDLINKLQKVEKALGTQAQRADEAERECSRLRGEVIRLQRGELPRGPALKHFDARGATPDQGADLN